VPRLDVKLSGGHGHDGAQQLDFGFDDGELRAYSADWIRKRRLKPSKLRVLKATGRSMERTIFDGDDLLVDLGEHAHSRRRRVRALVRRQRARETPLPHPRGRPSHQL
jgi:hypothetical protein